jgi:hypothetical protein
MVPGVGYDNAVKAGPAATRHQQLRRAPATCEPTAEEPHLIRDVIGPHGVGYREVPA